MWAHSPYRVAILGISKLLQLTDEVKNGKNIIILVIVPRKYRNNFGR